jgi:hypothetical protein
LTASSLKGMPLDIRPCPWLAGSWDNLPQVRSVLSRFALDQIICLDFFNAKYIFANKIVSFEKYFWCNAHASFGVVCGVCKRQLPNKHVESVLTTTLVNMLSLLNLVSIRSFEGYNVVWFMVLKKKKRLLGSNFCFNPPILLWCPPFLDSINSADALVDKRILAMMFEVDALVEALMRLLKRQSLFIYKFCFFSLFVILYFCTDQCFWILLVHQDALNFA